jgi:putative DNA primase/helicase
MPKASDDSPEGVRQRLEQLDAVWLGSHPVQPGDFVDHYLRSRGITLDVFPRDLACHLGLEYWHKSEPNQQSELIGKFPAMLAIIKDPQGVPVSLHRTYLKSDGSGKLFDKNDGRPSKKFMKFTHSGAGDGAAIRLFEPGPLMLITEGIENALSAHLMTGYPAWAARDSGSLEKWQPPPQVKEVWIGADNDVPLPPFLQHGGNGRAKAQKLADCLHFQGVKTLISMPDEPGSDWADWWKQNGK